MSILIVNVIDKTAGGNELLHELRKCLSLVLLNLGHISYDTAVKINLNLITILNIPAGLSTLDDWQTYIDCIAVENAGKALGNDHRDARGQDGHGGVLT